MNELLDAHLEAAARDLSAPPTTASHTVSLYNRRDLNRLFTDGKRR
jgi:hypothetical protein